MIRSFVLLAAILFSSAASAQITPAMLKDFIGGLRLSNDVAAPNTVLDISAGSAVDSASTVFIQVPATNKSVACSWTAGVGGCGMAPGLSVSADHWYSVFAINNGGAGDIYFDQPSVAPTSAPAGTTAYRHLGWFRSGANSNILGMLCIDDLCWWNYSNNIQDPHDYGVYNPCNAAVAASWPTPPYCTSIITLAHIPPGAPVTAILNLMISNISVPPAAIFWVLTSPDAPYTSSIGVSGSEPQALEVVTNQVQIPTNAYAQVLSTVTSNPKGAGSSPTIFVIDSKGWIYHRTPPPPAPVPPPPPPGSVIPSVIAAGATAAGVYSSASVNMNAPIPTGNLIVVGVAINSTNNVGVASVSDGVNTYVKAKKQAISVNSDLEMWYVVSTATMAPGTSLTVNLTGSTGAGSSVGIVALQDAGLSALPLDQTAGIGGTGSTSLTVATGALAQANELAIGCSYQINAKPYLGAPGFTAGSTASMPGGNGAIWCDYKLTSAVTPVSYVPAWTIGADRNGAIVATFK